MVSNPVVFTDSNYLMGAQFICDIIKWSFAFVYIM